MIKTDSVLDLFISIIVVLAFFGIWSLSYANLVSKDFGGFDTDKEKTAKKVSAVIAAEEHLYSYAEIMLTLNCADEYTPMPRKFSINKNGKVFTIDVNDNFFANRSNIITQVSNLLKTNENDKFSVTSKVTAEGVVSWDINVK